jgi:hypothetical protein
MEVEVESSNCSVQERRQPTSNPLPAGCLGLGTMQRGGADYRFQGGASEPEASGVELATSLAAMG